MNLWTIAVRYPGGDARFTWKTATDLLSPPPINILSVIMLLLVIQYCVLRYSIAYHPQNKAANKAASSNLKCPWHLGSHFAFLLTDLEAWASNMLSPKLYFNKENLLWNNNCLAMFSTGEGVYELF